MKKIEISCHDCGESFVIYDEFDEIDIDSIEYCPYCGSTNISVEII